ncbi:3-dehydroquinate synthase [Kordia periserrulae]|uniref:3-dehydroquinate synthase n=1 Tax=Kordia periserrulae TaxID=701523 RepID=A0A2T6BZV7_9FLAO|nr:3-dehydroquinate synthase [Kordia periserrulae]PTX61595.1 3-dehydroquinate synthase [Kordia periserrulae]
MNSIQAANYFVHFNANCYTELQQHLAENNYSKIFILVDEHTHEFCLPYFMSNLQTEIPVEVIEILAGEIHKNIETCVGVWNVLSELDGDRKSLMINVGGGVVTDLGGFVASTFKRGISYINVPTSLLSMVDASVGGKTGVDLGTLKNQIGVINTPEMVLIDTSFLNTLPANEMRSGLAEMLKHGLIYDENYWKKMIDLASFTIEDLDNLIYDSVIIKNTVVTEDPKELGLRKILNYGHTLGHAIESYLLTHESKEALLHGEAIAIGMVLESYISYQQEDFPKEKLAEIKRVILDMYGKVTFEDSDYESIMDLMKYDKKNSHGNINFVLLNDIGAPVLDKTVPNETIVAAFQYYNS